MNDLLSGLDKALDDAERDFAGAKGEGEAAEQTEEPTEDGGQTDVEQEVEAEAEGSDEPEVEDTGPSWEDRVDELPIEKLPPKIAKMRSDRDRLASELGEARRQRESLQQRLAKFEAAAKAAEPQVEDEKPPRIEEDDYESYEKLQAKFEAIADWRVKQATRALEQKFQTIEQRDVQAQVEQAEHYMMEQANRIQAMPGFTEDVGREMIELLGPKDSPMWGTLGSPDGWDKLYRFAKSEVNERSKQTNNVTHKATAQKREVPRASPSARQVTEDIDMPEDPSDVGGRVDAIMDGLFGG